MSEPTPPTPPITKPSPTSAASPEPPKKSGGVSLGALIGVGAAVVVLSFLAAFLGSSLARSNDAAPAPTATTVEQSPVPTPKSSAEVEEIIKEILPAGSAVRAGKGAPTEGKGYEGDVYIDVSNANVYVFRDGQWVLAGNIKESAAENLTGPAGETGQTGETGATGAQGEPGTPGTQVLLGTGKPSNETCTSDGDVYIDTATTPTQFYSCDSGQWMLSGSPAPLPSEPTPSATPNE